MKDSDHNAGYVAWVGRVCKEDPHICGILWEAGAVFYVRSTQPQCLMYAVSSYTKFLDFQGGERRRDVFWGVKTYVFPPPPPPLQRNANLS